MNTGTAVVVGVDGSPDSLNAVEWAAADALRRSRPLRIVHAFLWPTVYAPLAVPAPPQLYEETMREAAEQILDEAATRAGAAARGVAVSRDRPTQHPPPALVPPSRHAATAVVGNRGLGGFPGLLLGSVGV